MPSVRSATPHSDMPETIAGTTEKLGQLGALWMGAQIAVGERSADRVGVATPDDAVRVGKLLEARNA